MYKNQGLMDFQSIAKLSREFLTFSWFYRKIIKLPNALKISM